MFCIMTCLNHFWCQTTARFAKSKYCATLMSQTKLWGSQIDSFRIEILSLIFDSLAAVGMVCPGGFGDGDISRLRYQRCINDMLLLNFEPNSR